MQRIVLAYASALESSEAISWLAATHAAEIVALTLDFGQGRELEALRDRALAAGAVRAHVVDVADAFANHFVLPALKAGALFSGGRPMIAGLERALLAQKLVEIAAIEQTTTIAHGCAAGDCRVATAAQTLKATLTVLTLPASIIGTADCQMSARSVASVGAVPSEPASVEITFVRGAPTAINGIAMPLGDLIGTINMLARTAAIGRSKVPDTPAAMVMHEAHQGLRDVVAADDDEWPTISRAYADIIDSGSWFSPARDALNGAIDRRQDAVSGSVRLKLFKGNCEIVEKTPAAAAKPLTMAAVK